MAKTDLTAERLRELLDYNPETGIFTWKVAVANKKAGDVAGCKRRDGYILVRIDRALHLAHRLAWMYCYGEWPKQLVDHIDGNAGNNRIENLRDVSDTGNNQNQRKARSINCSGLIGVSKHKKSWSAVISVNGARIRLGTFSTPEKAHSVYVDAKRLLHATCTI